MNELKTKSEQFALKSKVFYFYTPDGFGISKLATRVRPAARRGNDGAQLAHGRQAPGADQRMRPSAFVLAVLLAVSLNAHAQQCPDIAPYQKARDTIQDLGRIVAPNGIQESYKTKIGGIDQWINVRGQDQANPIILFVHGGPASPLIPTLWQFQRPLEEYFTVVNYDQRGAGKTYVEDHSDAVADTLHIPRYIDDAIEVAEHVRKRYGKSKVILMAHSWGTVIGLGAALKQPDLFYAYVGIGQVINTRDNERISFEYGLQQAKAHGNAAAVKELESIAPYPGDQPITRERIILARKWAQFYGGLSAFREESRYFFNAPLLSPEYSAADVCAVDQGNVFTLGRVLPEFLNVDYKGVRSLSIPVFMFMGRHDYTTPAQPTADWLAQGERAREAGCVVRALLAYDSVGRARQDADEPGAVRAPAGRAERQSTLTIRMSFARFCILLSSALPSCTAATAAAFDFDDVAEQAQIAGTPAVSQLRPQGAGGAAGAHLRPVPRHPLPPRACAVARGEAAVRADVLPSRQVSERAGAHQRDRRRKARATSPIDSGDFDFGKNKLSPQELGRPRLRRLSRALPAERRARTRTSSSCSSAPATSARSARVSATACRRAGWRSTPSAGRARSFRVHASSGSSSRRRMPRR